MAIEVTPKQFRHLVKKRLRADLKLMQQAAYEAATFGVAVAVRKTDEKQLVDRSTFKRGWASRRIKGGGEMGNSAPHAPVLEYGRRPGRPGPPLAPILAWVGRKFGMHLKDEFRAAKGLALTFASAAGGDKAARGRRRGRVRRSFGPMKKAVGRRAYLIARAIRRNIHVRGTPPHGVLASTVPEMEKMFQAEIRRLLAR